MTALARDGRDGIPGRDGRDSRNDTPRENQLSVALLLNDLRYIKDKIDEMCTQGEAQDKRLNQVERVTWAIGIVTGLIGSIVVGVTIVVLASALKAQWGLP